MVSDKKIERIHHIVKRCIEDTGRMILDEKKDEKRNRAVFVVKHGLLSIFVVHPLDQKFIEVVFDFVISDKYLEKFRGLFDDQVEASKFIYELKCVMMNPNTFSVFKWDHISDKMMIPIGFNASARLYPLDKSFNLHLFDNIFMQVINSGLLGASLYGVKLQITEGMIQQREASSSSPDGMFI